jgi:4-aminobutyrate aminotransferase
LKNPKRRSRKTASLVRRLENSIASSNRISFFPLVAKSAKGSQIVDVEGRTFLDFNSSWTATGLGYSNDQIVSTILRELKNGLGVSELTLHPSETTIKLAEKLIKITPGRYKKRVWFGHSASDACAAAYKLFPIASRRDRIVSFYGSMHGSDLAGLIMSGIPMTGDYSTSGLVSKMPFAYCYRCPFGLEYPSCDLYCAGGYLEDQVLRYASPPDKTSFLIIEPIQADSGDIVPPDGYLESLHKVCKRYAIQFVVDEAKIGFGRTGKMFAVEGSPSVIPDSVALGKAMGSGLPIGALVARSELLEGANMPLLASTLRGNSLAAAASIATIDYLEGEHLLDRVEKLGHYLLERLEELKGKHELIGDVRAKGLIAGVELVKDRRSKDPPASKATKVVKRAWSLGLILVYSGPYSNVLEITPPLTISKEELDRGIDILDSALTFAERN